MIKLTVILLIALFTATPKITPSEPIQQNIVEPSRGATRTITCEASAYDLRGTTATGTIPGPGTIAVDPTVIPLGSRLLIEGYGEGIALDTGGSIKGRKIDIWFADRDTCLDWGRKNVEVIILEGPENE